MLEKLKTLGVKELQVTNGQAVAVNPYEKWDYSDTTYTEQPTMSVKWRIFNNRNLPPLPCAESVKEGRYRIDRFEEEHQVYWADDRWIKASPENQDWYESEDYPLRTVLILSEPVAKSEKETNRKNNMDNNDILETVKDFLVESNLTSKFKKWVEKQEFEDNEEFDLKEWID